MFSDNRKMRRRRDSLWIWYPWNFTSSLHDIEFKAGLSTTIRQPRKKNETVSVKAPWVFGRPLFCQCATRSHYLESDVRSGGTHGSTISDRDALRVKSASTRDNSSRSLLRVRPVMPSLKFCLGANGSSTLRAISLEPFSRVTMCNG